MLGLRAGWRRPTASVLTYGGEVVAAHRLGDGWARRRRTGEAEVGDDEDTATTVARGSGRRGRGRSASIVLCARHSGRQSSGKRSGRTTTAHWAETSSGRWSGPRRGGGLGVAGRRRGALGAAVRSSRSGRRGARDDGGEEDRRRRRLSVGKGGEEEGELYRGGWPFVPGCGSTRDKRCFWAGRENSQPTAHL